MADFHKAGLLHLKDGRILLCRKEDPTSLLILPGGKLEKGETAQECLRRECREELGDVEIANLNHLGDYESPAAGDENKTVKIELFAGELRGTPAAHAEIKELVWFGPRDDAALLAPSLRNIILPDLRRRGLIALEDA
ncbi:MAG TPA: NUDIX domain-containing protein [Bryobacteraceae bacterium]|nr:NUDIX domain-containing protein [Bryobacteraceae bacterium]